MPNERLATAEENGRLSQIVEWAGPIFKSLFEHLIEESGDIQLAANGMIQAHLFEAASIVMSASAVADPRATYMNLCEMAWANAAATITEAVPSQDRN